MDKYIHFTEQFGINNDGIHLLRSRYNYKSIPFSDIASIEFKRGKVIKNWLLLLLFGLGCLVFSLFYSYIIFDFFISDEQGRIYIEEIVVPVIPAFAGIAALLVSLRTSEVAIVNYNTSKLVLDLSELAKQNKVADFVIYLSERAGVDKVRNITNSYRGMAKA
ncbi:hypothetical protein [Pontibacter populi]|uniref:DUF3341 domain-containing protein n=1 Tax=Pontibacter populi TaxID=890055 RepID=A0ABV1RV99_9BACT